VAHTRTHTGTPELFITDGAAANEPMGVATGDFVFVGDVGRPDLLESAAGQENVMEPSARTLFKTVEEFKKLPEYMQVWPGHGAGSACGKALGAIPETTVGYELRYNNSLKSATSEDNFVNFILEGQPEPPLYFARMKRDNKIGPAIIGGVPKTKDSHSNELRGLVGKEEGVVILDTREKEEYAAGHIPGSLLSPLNKQFNTVAGSYITEDDQIYLVVEENISLTEAIRDLYRIGLDNVVGYVTPRDILMYKDQGGDMEKLDVVKFEDVENLDSNELVVDVRKASEYEASHVEGAVNFAHTRLLPNKENIPADKKLYLHCMTGGRSAVASAFLKRNGFDVALIDDDFEKYMSKVKA
jgi:hydroxyacylglutathione hydrolase